jgi:hypothetical protein
MDKLDMFLVTEVLPRLHFLGIHNWFIDYDEPDTKFCAQCGTERPV